MSTQQARIRNEREDQRSGSIDRWLLDFPWGIVAFLVLAIGGLIWTLISKELTAGAYLGAVSGGAGLLAVGHGIREHGKMTMGRNASSNSLSLDPSSKAHSVDK
jgi:hypothetical protein